MKRMYIIGGISLILVIVGFSIWQLTNSLLQPPKSSNITPSSKPLPKEVTVTLDKKDFSPKTVTINVGSAVRWKNASGEKQTVNSDNYPTNQLHKELNFGIFNDNSSVVYIFKKPGVYGYHNQLHPEQQGKIKVTN